MDSRELYKKETGREPIYYNGECDELTNDYLLWLEQEIIKLSNMLGIKPLTGKPLNLLEKCMDDNAKSEPTLPGCI